MSSILFVEDDDTIALGVENLLDISGYEVHHFNSAEQALNNLPSWDLAVLDVMLPGMDGVELLKHLKRQSPEKPIILLTAKANTRDIIQGLDGGANDYVTKPFQIGELLARIRTRLRDTQLSENRTIESQNTGGHIFQLGEATIDLRRQIITKKNLEITLTTYEKMVLTYLYERQGQDISRQELLEKVWGYSPSMQTRTVDNQILKLRKKLEDNHSKPRHILTVHGIGYRLEL